MYKNVCKNMHYKFLHLYTLLYTFKQFSIFLYVFLYFIKIGTYIRKFSGKNFNFF